jgi:dCTP deaminase
VENFAMSFSLLSDREIKELCTGDRPMLSPFEPELVRKIDFLAFDRLDVPYQVKTKAISYGLSSYGYDLQLSPKRLRIFKKKPIWQQIGESSGLLKPQIIDPKDFDESVLYDAKQYRDRTGTYWVMPPHSVSLGTTPTCFDMPHNIIGVALGKSTYARCAVNPIVTPAEPMWKGHLTLEIANNSDFHCKIYANEGITQILFLRGADCETDYSDRKGKYQDQGEEVVLARA